MAERVVRILVADDHGIVREGLKSLIAREPDMDVVGEAADGETAIRLAVELQPDVVVVDITMPKLNGIEAIQQIRAHVPAVKIIVLSMHAEGHIVRAAMEAGASGYLLKTNLFDELRRALVAVGAGGRYLSPRITDLVVRNWLAGHEEPVRGPTAELTARERKILQFTAEGRSVKEIGCELGLSAKTIHANRRQLMEKLDLGSVAELTRYAITAGIISLES
jgi:DNA-binding NarL/FixJ family response regulator